MCWPELLLITYILHQCVWFWLLLLCTQPCCSMWLDRRGGCTSQLLPAAGVTRRKWRKQVGRSCFDIQEGVGRWSHEIEVAQTPDLIATDARVLQAKYLAESQGKSCFVLISEWHCRELIWGCSFSRSTLRQFNRAHVVKINNNNSNNKTLLSDRRKKTNFKELKWSIYKIL